MVYIPLVKETKVDIKNKRFYVVLKGVDMQGDISFFKKFNLLNYSKLNIIKKY